MTTHFFAIAGHRDNHGLFLTQEQIETVRTQHGIAAGEEWDKTAGLGHLQVLNHDGQPLMAMRDKQNNDIG